MAMLQPAMQARVLEPLHPTRQRGLLTRQVRASSPGEKAESALSMQRRIEELLLLCEFNAAIGTLNDPQKVSAAACSWLEDVVNWKVVSVSSTEGELCQHHYQVLHLDEHLSKLNPEPAGHPDSHSTGAGVISIPFPDRAGVLTVSRQSVLVSQLSDEFITGVVASLSRALCNAREYHRLKTLSMHDHLTGLYNRRVFEAMLEVEARKRSSKPFSLLLIDLDNFKTINDSYGHSAGDEVLVHVADMLRLNFRKSDIPARYGGDEFSVLLPDTPLALAQRIAERFRDSVAAARPGRVGNKPVPTVSVGIASVVERSKVDVAQMVQEADRALYRAKAPGKNRVCGALVE